MTASPFYTDGSVTLHHGDCLDVLRDLPDGSVDAVVTDPPYGLEFMGKSWDKFGTNTGNSEKPRFTSDHMGKGFDKIPNTFEAGAPFQRWCSLWATECLRVLKPGGHLLAFGGTRTWHRLACAIEDAGFEMRDSIAWLYGCHDDETEALTSRGWVRGLDLTDDDELAQWFVDGTVEFVRPSALHRYPYEGRLVRFRNSDVDQAVTPNHRVVRQVSERTMTDGVRVAEWSPWRVDEAGDVNRWQPMRVPAGGDHDGPGIGGTDYAALLGWVWAEGGFDRTGTGIRVYQSSVNADRVDEIAALLDRLGAYKRYDRDREWRDRSYVETCWYVSGELANRVRADLPGKHPTWELLLRMTAAEKRALWDAAMKGDGSRDQRVFWQKDRDDLEWAQALLALTSRRGVLSAKSSLCWTERPTVELQARHLRDESMAYAGDVWCATVPSGAFVVRRNGRVSVSGNSGFPKSLDVAKAIDKAAGAEREVVGSRPLTGTARIVGGQGSVTAGRSEQMTEDAVAAGRMRDSLDLTAPATDDARTWQGWGTALKPAHEPIVVARKPLAGTVAGNVLAHGTGALNVDGCRVGVSDADRAAVVGREYVAPAASDRTAYSAFADDGTRKPIEYAPGSRWPANVVLDESQAAELDRQSGYITPGNMPARRNGIGSGAKGTEGEAITLDGGGASRFFYVAKAPTVERPRDGQTAHPTVKPLDLMRWLVRLVTPPGGLVLDPFAGSGTTAEACVIEGFQCITVEREADYLPLIVARLSKPIQVDLFAAGPTQRPAAPEPAEQGG